MKTKEYNNVLNYIKDIINGSIWENHVFAVGGCVRDEIMGNEIKDIDIVIDIANGGISFSKWLCEKNITTHEPIVYEQFGTAMFVLREFPDIEIEAVQTRKECYRDAKTRNPETSFGTMADDWTRRDFTINAIYKNISTGKFVDFDNRGINDIKNKIIRTCGASEIIFDEDSLRIMRMVRFAARLGFDIEDETFECAKKYVNRLEIISKERIHDEFVKMCEVKNFLQFRDAMCLLWDLGAFPYILPYLSGTKHMKDCFLMLDDFHEMYGVNGYHLSVEEIFAYLLYGCPDAEEEMRELKCDNEFIRNVMFYINTAKKHKKEFENEDYVGNETFYFRRMMNICGDSRKLHFILSIDADLRDYFFDTDFEEDTTFKEMERDNLEYYTYKLPVNGNDVMEVLGIKPGPAVKSVLNSLMNFAYVNKDFKDEKSIRDYLKYIGETGEKISLA